MRSIYVSLPPGSFTARAIPVLLDENGVPVPATGEDGQIILDRFRALSKNLGLSVEISAGQAVVASRIPAAQ